MTLVLLDTCTYLRLAKRIRPLLGEEFGQKRYVLTVLKDVEAEVRRKKELQFKFPWFDAEEFGDERDAKQVRLSAAETAQLKIFASVLRGHVLSQVDRFTRDGRQPPSDTDCRVLAFAQIREAIVATDDIGMHTLARDFELDMMHGWDLLAKMRAAKKIDNDLIRDIYEALERNSDLPASWVQAKKSHFARVF